MSRRSEIPTTPEGLRKYVRVIDDQDICIGCGCVSVCPTNAWELDENGKARLIWDWCIDDFSCIPVCPVNCNIAKPRPLWGWCCPIAWGLMCQVIIPALLGCLITP
jgi:NAD-dependent dihydropyrimidine dehydrogenase PreA subunit